MSEATLAGGNTVGAVRIGDVVHKQASPWTPGVQPLDQPLVMPPRHEDDTDGEGH